MVQTKQVPTNQTAVRPRRRGISGGGFLFLLFLLLIGALALGGLAIFVPTRLALPQEQVLGLLHGGVVDTFEETYVDGCVQVDGQEGLRAVTRTRRYTTFRDGTTLEVVFSDRPAITNACP